jgi:hypothetical protein
MINQSIDAIKGIKSKISKPKNQWICQNWKSLFLPKKESHLFRVIIKEIIDFKDIISHSNPLFFVLIFQSDLLSRKPVWLLHCPRLNSREDISVRMKRMTCEDSLVMSAVNRIPKDWSWTTREILLVIYWFDFVFDFCLSLVIFVLYWP